MPTRKRQHFVPASYLARFTDPNDPERLCVYSKKGDEVRPSTPGNEGYEKYTYAVQQADGSLDKDSIETELGQLDDQGANLIGELEAGHVLKAQQWFDLSYYIAMLFMRNPLTMKNAETVSEGMLREDMKDAIAEGDIERSVRGSNPELPPPVISELVRRTKETLMSGAYELKYPKGFAVRSFKWADNLARKMSEMRWSIFVTEGAQFFVSSDNPVFIGLEDQRAKKISYGVLDHPNAYITVPLSRRLGLRADQGTPPFKAIIAASGSDVCVLNERTILSARRWIYSPRQDPTVNKLTESHKDSSFELKTGNPYLEQIVRNLRRKR